MLGHNSFLYFHLILLKSSSTNRMNPQIRFKFDLIYDALFPFMVDIEYIYIEYLEQCSHGPIYLT